MAREADIWSLDTIRVNVGVSAIIGITSGVGVASIVLKYLSGGTLEILGATTQTRDTGYVLGTSEAFMIGGPATFFLASSGATSVLCIAKGKTNGT